MTKKDQKIPCELSKSIYQMISDDGDVIGNNLIVTDIEYRRPWVIVHLGKLLHAGRLTKNQKFTPIGELKLDKVQWNYFKYAIQYEFNKEK